MSVVWKLQLGPDGTRYEVMQREDKTVTVTPWPFEKKQFTVNVEASNLNQIKFDSSKELTGSFASGTYTGFRMDFY